MPKQKTLKDFEDEAYMVPAPYKVLAKPCLIGRGVRARHIYQLRHGTIGDKRKYVCHHCDRSKCIENTHHYLGTAQSNVIDTYTRGLKENQKAANKRQEKRAKHSQAMLGNQHLRGHRHSEETKARMSKVKIGKKHSRATKKKLVAAWLLRKEKTQDTVKHFAFCYGAQ